jgi:hypothetical protein
MADAELVERRSLTLQNWCVVHAQAYLSAIVMPGKASVKSASIRIVFFIVCPFIASHQHRLGQGGTAKTAPWVMNT